MYDLVSNIIGHTWQSNTTSDQQIIYYICGTLIVILTVVFIDGIRHIFRRFTGR